MVRWPSEWKLFGRTFTGCQLFFNILQNGIWKIRWILTLAPFERESKDSAVFRALRRLPSTFPGLKCLEIKEALKSLHTGYLFIVLLALIKKLFREGVSLPKSSLLVIFSLPLLSFPWLAVDFPWSWFVWLISPLHSSIFPPLRKKEDRLRWKTKESMVQLWPCKLSWKQNLKTCFNYLLIFVSRFLPAFLPGLSAIKEQ